MKLISDSQSYSKYKNQIKGFKKLYIKGFPDINEREDFEVILRRVFGKKKRKDPNSIIILSISEDDNQEVMGGLIADWYEKSKSVHLIYLIINEKFRGKGIAKTLINDGVADIKSWIKKEKGIEIKNVFFESNNPLKTRKEDDSFDPIKRLEIFSHLGAKHINIQYIQPALDKKKKEVDNLLLLSFPQFNIKGDKIPATDIVDFLKDLYISLGETEDNESFKNMVSNLDRIKDKDGEIEMEPMLNYPKESTLYKFKKSSVTFHFIEKIDNQTKNKNESKATENCPHFSSFETDLFTYQNQKSNENRPFRTVFKKFFQDAVLIQPSNYIYKSEGHSHTRKTESDRTEIKINISVSHSIFEKSGNKIIHITIAPTNDSYFTELDLIKLSTFFGGKQEESSINERIRFQINGSDKKTNLEELLENIYGNEQKYQFENLTTGIIQIELNEVVTTNKTDFNRFFDVFVKNQKDLLTNEIRDFSKALCGIVLGIFDFERMQNDEIFDTIIPIVSNKESFMVMCRGSLLKISTEDDLINSVSKHIIVSPYALIANTVLAYNEYILFDLKKKIDKMLEEDSKSKPRLKELDDCLMNSRKVLNYQYLHDIFQYPSEKEIIEYGNSQRGINNLNVIIKKRVEQLSELIEITKTKKSKLPDALISALLGFIAVIKLNDIFGELLREKYSDSFIYIVTAVFSTAVAGTIFWLVWIKKK